jgi:hypothetical protein
VRDKTGPVQKPEKSQSQQGAYDHGKSREKSHLLLMLGQNRLSPASGQVGHNSGNLAHNDFRRSHDDDRWRDDDFVVAFVPCVLMAATIPHQTAGGGEEGNETGKQKDLFHICFVYGRLLVWLTCSGAEGAATTPKPLLVLVRVVNGVNLRASGELRHGV